MKTLLRCACLLLTLVLLAAPCALGEGAQKGTRRTPTGWATCAPLPPRVLADGSPRQDATDAAFTAVPMELTLVNYLPPAYFAGTTARFTSSTAQKPARSWHSSTAAMWPSCRRMPSG